MHRLVLALALISPLLAADPAPPVQIGEIAYQKTFADLAHWATAPAGCATIVTAADAPARVVICPTRAGGAGAVGARDVLGVVEHSKNPSFIITTGLGLLPRYRGCQLTVSVLVAAKDVPKPARPWEGVRVAINYLTSTGAFNQFVSAGHGTFASREVTMTTRIPADAKDLSCDLGLLAPTGEVSFERITMTVSGLPLAALTPPTQPAYKGHDLGRLRGFNTGLRNPASPEAIKAITALGNDWKTNVFKLWFSVRKDFAETDRALAAWMDEVEKALPAAQAAQVLAILHVSAWDWQVAEHGGNERVYEDPIYAAKAVEVFETIARRFRGDRRIYAIELLNESVIRLPPATGCPDYEGLMERCALAINAIDPGRAVIVQPEQWWGNRAFDKLRPIRAKNLVYAPHCYAPFGVSHQGVGEFQGGATEWTARAYPGTHDGVLWDRETLRRDLQPARDFQLAHGVHMLVSEFGCVRWALGDSRQRLLKDMIELFEEYGWDWLYHASSDWHGWAITLDHDPWNHVRPAQPTSAETLLRSWFTRNQRPAPP
jgi:endoglucanase